MSLTRANMRGVLEKMIQFTDDWSHRRLTEDPPLHKFIIRHPVSWAKEFRTVKFGLGRGAGHTTAVAWYANHNLKKVHHIVFSKDQLAGLEDPPGKPDHQHPT